MVDRIKIKLSQFFQIYRIKKVSSLAFSHRKQINTYMAAHLMAEASEVWEIFSKDKSPELLLKELADVYLGLLNIAQYNNIQHQEIVSEMERIIDNRDCSFLKESENVNE